MNDSFYRAHPSFQLVVECQQLHAGSQAWIYSDRNCVPYERINEDTMIAMDWGYKDQLVKAQIIKPCYVIVSQWYECHALMEEMPAIYQWRAWPWWKRLFFKLKEIISCIHLLHKN